MEDTESYWVFEWYHPVIFWLINATLFLVPPPLPLNPKELVALVLFMFQYVVVSTNFNELPLPPTVDDNVFQLVSVGTDQSSLLVIEVIPLPVTLKKLYR